jgi:hypothetical protein
MQLSHILLAITWFLGLVLALPLPQRSVPQKYATPIQYSPYSTEELPLPVSPPAKLVRTPPPPRSLEKRPTAVEYAVHSVEELPVPVSPPSKLKPRTAAGTEGGKPARSPPIPPLPPPKLTRDTGVSGGKTSVVDTTGATGGKTARSDDLPVPPPPPPTADTTGATGGKTARDLPVPPPPPPPTDASAISDTRTLGTSQRDLPVPALRAPEYLPLPGWPWSKLTREEDPEPDLISIAAIAARDIPGEDGAEKK